MTLLQIGKRLDAINIQISRNISKSLPFVGSKSPAVRDKARANIARLQAEHKVLKAQQKTGEALLNQRRRY